MYKCLDLSLTFTAVIPRRMTTLRFCTDNCFLSWFRRSPLGTAEEGRQGQHLKRTFFLLSDCVCLLRGARGGIQEGPCACYTSTLPPTHIASTHEEISWVGRINTERVTAFHPCPKNVFILMEMPSKKKGITAIPQECPDPASCPSQGSELSCQLLIGGYLWNVTHHAQLETDFE